jgi:hypothetical protein
MKLLKIIDAPLLGIDVKKLLHQPVTDCDYNKVIKTNCKVNLEGNPPIIYLADFKGQDAMGELLPHLLELNYSVSQRKGLGVNNKSILFGSVPANINKSNFCTYGAVADHDSVLHSLLINKFSTYLHAIIDKCTPGWAKVWNILFRRKHIHPDYQMALTFWTSGIINYNSVHNFHFDTMNVHNMISAMITYKSNVKGGYLCFPEYGLAFEVKDHSAIFFAGQSILHGVSPMEIGPGGHRISVVYYTTDAITKCAPYAEETQKALLK